MLLLLLLSLFLILDSSLPSGQSVARFRGKILVTVKYVPQSSAQPHARVMHVKKDAWPTFGLFSLSLRLSPPGQRSVWKPRQQKQKCINTQQIQCRYSRRLIPLSKRHLQLQKTKEIYEDMRSDKSLVAPLYLIDLFASLIYITYILYSNYLTVQIYNTE